MKLFPTAGYIRFYHSLVHFFYDISGDKSAKLTYTLYTANLDSYKNRRPDLCLPELSKADFLHRLTKRQQKPYRTIIQLYCAMEALYLNIDVKIITVEQLKTHSKIWSLMDDIKIRFRKAFYMEIYDKRTVYSLCKQSLNPRKNEPGLCLMQDWITREDEIWTIKDILIKIKKG